MIMISASGNDKGFHACTRTRNILRREIYITIYFYARAHLRPFMRHLVAHSVFSENNIGYVTKSLKSSEKLGLTNQS
jgi:hypothetical protein